MDGRHNGAAMTVEGKERGYRNLARFDGEVRQEVPPRAVVGEDPDVQHVGVREHDVRSGADRSQASRRRAASSNGATGSGQAVLR